MQENHFVIPNSPSYHNFPVPFHSILPYIKQYLLQERLQAVQYPHSMLHCRDTLCGDLAHSKARVKVVLDVLLTVVECS